MSTVTVMVKMSAVMKKHIATYAEDHDMTMSEVMRSAAAQFTEYDMDGDLEMEARGRPRVYASDEQRKEAARKRQQDKAEHERMVVAAVMKHERLQGAAALQRWLDDRGISLDDETTAVAS